MPFFQRRTFWAALPLFALALAALLFYSKRERPYDPNFDTRVAERAYRMNRPRVLYDEAHLNVHSANERYRPFTELITNDGYDIQVNRDPFTKERLAGASVLVIVLARGANDSNDNPAFTEAEITAVDQWVRSGGSLLLITDHAPFGAAAASLGRRFGVGMTNGMVEDPKNHEAALGPSTLIFSRENGLLADHAITRGRNPAERVERVLTFTGQSLQAPPDGAVFLSLSRTATDRLASPPAVERSGGDVRVTFNYGDPVPAKGRTQGVTLEVGRGRVVMLGEAGMLAAYRDRRGGFPVGMNFPGYDNRQLALNIMHWLSRLL